MRGGALLNRLDPYNVATGWLRVVGEATSLPRILLSVRLDRGSAMRSPTRRPQPTGGKTPPLHREIWLYTKAVPYTTTVTRRATAGD